LNDSYFEEFVPRADQLNYIRTRKKIRRHCLTMADRRTVSDGTRRPGSFVEQMLAHRDFSSRRQPRFAVSNLCGVKFHDAPQISEIDDRLRIEKKFRSRAFAQRNDGLRVPSETVLRSRHAQALRRIFFLVPDIVQLIAPVRNSQKTIIH